MIERGLDWVYPLGGLDSRAGTAYACKNGRCRAIPIQSNMWYRMATRAMYSLQREEFERMVDRLQAKYDDSMYPLTEGGLKDVFVNPEWKCCICLTAHEGESWWLESFIFDTRADTASEDELFIAPFGRNCTQDQKKAFNYLRSVTLLMQLENKPLFTREEMLDAIQAINDRWGERLCQSASVHTVKAYDPEFPKRRGFETSSSKELFCISPQLSLPAWGMEVQVAYLPANPKPLSTEDIDELLEFCYSKVGSTYPDDSFEPYVSKTVDVNQNVSRVKHTTVWRQLREGRAALDDAARRAVERRSSQPANPNWT